MASQASDPRPAAEVLRRRWRVLAAAGAIGLAAGAGYLTQQPPRLASTALVLLPAAQAGGPATTDVATQARIVTSATILGAAGQAVQPALTARAMEKRVKVSSPTEQLLEIQAYAARRDQAQALAQAVADAYVAYVKSSAQAFSTATLANLRSRESVLAAQVTALTGQIGATSTRLAALAPTSAQGKREAQLLAQLRAEQADIVVALEQIKEKIAVTAPPGADPASGTAVVQPASAARGRPLLWQIALWPLTGGLLAVLLTAAAVLAHSRGDRRLRLRDEIADAAGVRVLASVASRPQRSVAGWSRLLATYRPGPVDAWAIRQALRALASADVRPAASTRGASRRASTGDYPTSVTVISLSGDSRGLAVGAQIASCAASLGIATRMVAGHGHPSGAALWNAVTARPSAEPRPQLVVGDSDPRHRPELTVWLTQVDRADPQLTELARTAATVLAVGAARCTQDDLARLTMAAHDAGRRLDGVIVADPDRSDRTHGRHSPDEREARVVLPMRLTGGTR